MNELEAMLEEDIADIEGNEVMEDIVGQDSMEKENVEKENVLNDGMEGNEDIADIEGNEFIKSNILVVKPMIF